MPTLFKQGLVVTGLIFSGLELRRCWSGYHRPRMLMNVSDPLNFYYSTVVTKGNYYNHNSNHNSNHINGASATSSKRGEDETGRSDERLFSLPSLQEEALILTNSEPFSTSSSTTTSTPATTTTTTTSTSTTTTTTIESNHMDSSSSSSSTAVSSLLTTPNLFGMDRVDRTKQLEFVHITKTGGSAIEMGGAAFGVQWGACHYVEVPHLGCDQPPDWEFPLELNMPQQFQDKTHSEPWHAPSHWLVPNPQPKDRYVNFLVVRDPYQRLLSEFYCSAFGYSGKVNVASLNAWIILKLQETTPYFGHLLPQHYYVFHHSTGERLVDHVLRYEALKDEFNLLMKLYHLNVRLPQKSKETHFVMSLDQANSRLTAANLTEPTIRLVNDYYRQDFELFGYKMMPPY